MRFEAMRGWADEGRHRRGLSMLLIASALSLAGSGAANATTLNPAVVAGSVFFNFQPPPPINFATFGTFSQTGPGGLVQFTASPTPAPSLSAQATISQGFTGRSSGQLIYDMQILGSAGNVDVSITVAGGAAGSSSTVDPFAGFALKASWSFLDATTGQLLVNDAGIASGALSGSFSQTYAQTLNFVLTAGHVYRITMTSDAFAAAGSSGELAFASAFIDPTFAFGPGVDPSYSFEFSAGIGNTPVPEPRALGLWAGVFAALAFARSGSPRRR